MSVIKISCIDQVLTLTNAPVIASGGVREDFVQFTFCERWNGFEKTAVFVRDAEVYIERIDASGQCPVPYDVLAEAGRFRIGVFGINAEEVRRTTVYLEYTIQEGAVTSVADPEDPASIYEQVLAAAAGKQDPLTFDHTPTEGSTNPVTSAGVYNMGQDLTQYIDEGVAAAKADAQAAKDEIGAAAGQVWQNTEALVADARAYAESKVNEHAANPHAHVTQEKQDAWDQHVADAGLHLTAEEKNAVAAIPRLNTRLYSGAWAKGGVALRLDEVENYTLFLLDIEGSQSGLLVIKEGSRLRGGNVVTLTSGATQIETFNATISTSSSGTFLEYQKHACRVISASGAITTEVEDSAVLAIYGII